MIVVVITKVILVVIVQWHGDIESGSGGESDGDGSKKYYCQCEKCVIF